MIEQPFGHGLLLRQDFVDHPHGLRVSPGECGSPQRRVSGNLEVFEDIPGNRAFDDFVGLDRTTDGLAERHDLAERILGHGGLCVIPGETAFDEFLLAQGLVEILLDAVLELGVVLNACGLGFQHLFCLLLHCVRVPQPGDEVVPMF